MAQQNEPLPSRTATQSHGFASSSSALPGQSQQQSTPHSAPAINLPKGGGAIRSAEKFSANPVTGSASFAVPISVPPGRAGFGPQLNLSYDSSGGNGPMGYGFSLSVPRVARKTDKGLPRYDDANPDTFILSDAEDLVPALREDGSADVFEFPNLHGKRYLVRRYRPRVENAFARIEWWREPATGETHWRTVTRDNITHIYGESRDARIQSPDKKPRVFAWLLERTYDDKGNVVAYEYKRENTDNVPDVCYEKNRAVGANRYLKRISYAHQTPYWPDVDPAVPNDWHFQVVLDYGDHDLTSAKPGDERNRWPCRPDAFSQYRAAFEVRTLRRLRSIFVLHRFAELGADPYLVSSTDFTYAEDGAPPKKSLVASFVTAITQCGYIRDAAGWRKQTLPPLELKYSEVEIDPTLHRLDPVAQENLPEGIDNRRYQWVDLDSEGLPGVLVEQVNGAWYYKPSDPIFEDAKPSPRARFLAMDEVKPRPSIAALASGGQQIFDLGGEGTQCLVDFMRPLAGYYERDEAGFKPFRSFREIANVDLSDPNVRTVDLTGDGHADILILGDVVFTWFPSKGKEGFGAPSVVRAPGNDERGARVVFARGGEAIILCDMSGDGMNDLVRVRASSVEFWPNLGYGTLGPKVTMSNPPKFDAANEFDPKRLRPIDVDGSGSTDFVYLHRGGAKVFYNRSANSFSDAVEIAHHAADNFSSVAALDLLGNGTACLVWSSPLGKDASQPMFYMDLMGGKKPHLLVEMRNNLGAETRVRYAPATKFYLEDRRAGKPWITKLPFPVHVVEQVEVFERISETKLVTRYKYHHGYFDSREKEFRGFSRVEQFDGEIFSRYSGKGLFTEVPKTVGEEFHLPPVRTVTWFHTGAFVARDRIATHLRGEYYAGDPKAKLLDDTTLPAGLSTREMREACRALKGRMLRQEVYVDDETALAGEPYVVTEYAYGLRRLQPKADNGHAVFHSYQSDAITYHYERKSADPRIGHEMALEVDKFGNVTQSVGIAYRRRPGPDVEPEQSKTLITYTSNRVFNKTDAREWYRIGVPIETRSFELTGFTPVTGDYFTLADFIVADADPVALRYDRELEYEKSPTSGRERRLIEHVRTLYRNDDLSGPLALGTVHSRAIVFETYKLAFTPGLLTKVFGSRVTEPMIRDEGRYVHSEGDANWWIPSGRAFFSSLETDSAAQELAVSRSSFFLPRRFLDASGNSSFATYDGYHLLVVRTKDVAGNVIVAKNHYRTVSPAMVTDVNGNRTAVRFDARGMVVATHLMGKSGSTDGDRFDEASDETSPQDDPTTRIFYDLMAYANNPPSRQPAHVRVLSRETHRSPTTKWQESHCYADGLGREIEKKIQAAPGLAPVRDAAGKLVRDAAGNMVPFQHTATRWIASGRVVFDNHGNQVKKYEPFFDSHARFNDEKDLVEFGVTPILRYDALDRLVRTELPNGTYSKVELGAWGQINWDENDTVLHSAWFTARGRPTLDIAEPVDQERRAAWLTARHAGTPTHTHLDGLSRSFLTVADNGLDASLVRQLIRTRSEFDIEGNVKAMTDGLGRKVIEFDYDIVGNHVRQVSMDAGERLALSNIHGDPIRQWDSRGQVIRTVYDGMQRPTHVYLSAATSTEVLVERLIYGERHPDAARNLRGRVHRHYDGAGVIVSERYDFKGNLVESVRRFAREYKQLVDWSGLAAVSDGPAVDSAAEPSLEPDAFRSHSRFDALNRLQMSVTPQGGNVLPNVIQPLYDESSFLKSLDAWLHLEGAPADLLDPSTADIHAIVDVKYNAKGQRDLIIYGNGSQTQYEYDPTSFRLSRLNTFRGSRYPEDCSNPPNPPCGVQNLGYTYDPVGNIVSVRDDAQQSIFFRNSRVEPSTSYVYDAMYRLVQATGREHLGLTLGGLNAPEMVHHDDAFRARLTHPHDGNAMGRYEQSYGYDAAGNIRQMDHRTASGGWTRRYSFDEASLLEGTRNSNRLSRTSLPGDDPSGPYGVPYDYLENGVNNRHGFITGMQHLPVMRWDFRDRLVATSKQVVSAGSPETTYYVYDASGSRVRKVTEGQAAAGDLPTRMRERLYLGGIEIYREFSGDGEETDLERETAHLMDDRRRVAVVDFPAMESGFWATLVRAIAPEQHDVRYQLANHLGSASIELDESGQVVSYEEYFPFGSTSYRGFRDGVDPGSKRLRFLSQELDEESGFYYCSARYYASWLGRWISADPLGIRDGVNLYAYAGNCPITWSDPSGLAKKPTPATPQGNIGNVAPYSAQPKSLYGAAGARISEDEHVIPRGKQQALTRDPRTGVSDYNNSHYRKNTTVRVERDMALNKTHANRGGTTADNAGTARLQAKSQNGQAINFKQEVLMESIDNAKRARDATGSKVTNAQIHRGALAQEGELFGIQRMKDTGSKLGATADDVDKALANFELAESGSSKGPKASMGARALSAGGKVVEVGGKALAVAGAAAGGWQIGKGINQMIEGEKAMGAVDVAEGSTNLGLSIGTAAAVKSGSLVAETGLAAGGLTLAAGVAAAGSVALVAETARAAIKGEDTPIDVADKFYGTHFGDIYGWVTGSYSK